MNGCAQSEPQPGRAGQSHLEPPRARQTQPEREPEPDGARLRQSLSEQDAATIIAGELEAGTRQPQAAAGQPQLHPHWNIYLVL